MRGGRTSKRAPKAIVMNASGCGAMIKEYGHLLRHDAVYAAKAARISELTRDLGRAASGTRGALKDKLRTTTRQARGLSSALHVAARTEAPRRGRGDAVVARRRSAALRRRSSVLWLRRNLFRVQRDWLSNCAIENCARSWSRSPM